MFTNLLVNLLISEPVNGIPRHDRRAFPRSLVVDRKGTQRPLTNDDILIVAPYNAQVGALGERLPDARIGTVDKFQGQDELLCFGLACELLPGVDAEPEQFDESGRAALEWTLATGGDEADQPGEESMAGGRRRRPGSYVGLSGRGRRP